MSANLRYKLTIAYDGSGFHGWQKQEPPGEPALRTVQGVVEQAARAVLKQPIRLTGASRTDAGVHALGQVAQLDAHTPIPVERMAPALNARLPDDVEVRHVEVADPSFEAIGGARTKRYRYRIWNTPQRPLTLRQAVYHFWTPVDAARMNDAAARLTGEHDFAGFAAAGHGRQSTVRTIHRCQVIRCGDGLEDGRGDRRGDFSRHVLPPYTDPIALPDETLEPPTSPEVHVIVEGNGFLYNMVRIIVGTLLEIGRGHWPVEKIDEILEMKDRRLAGPTTPPQGLCLEWIRYE